MAENSPASDKSLLERLNALKPTSVNLISPSSSNSYPASTIERTTPPSREDALTARLKSLRHQGSNSAFPTATESNKLLGQDRGKVTPSHPSGDTKLQAKESSDLPQAGTPVSVTDDIDPLLFTDDQTLAELLEDLRSDDTWLDQVATEEEEHQRVTALLAELGNTPNAGVSGSDVQDQDAGSSSDDDSQGDDMVKEADSVLAKALDEVEWEKANKPPSPNLPGATAMHDSSKHQSQDDTDKGPNLESPPSTGPLNLPQVPSESSDELSSPQEDQSDRDFTASIASRMAALKLSGARALPSAPAEEVDALGLPVAPTFAPADRPVPGLARRWGATDAEQKTWCVVCLEDGAVRCLGCDVDDNIYCARCWKEMHVGPRAGYDERGHSWETFVSKKR
ncbi:hypothetical protein GGS20DRAFT_544460 [Poronia punctata]|nr:hypothetical protein GGS20DRAFT_544460 [Poronia punctata]